MFLLSNTCDNKQQTACFSVNYAL